MRPFSLLVKPVGGACNLACSYCFYREHASGVMSPAVAERLFSSYDALPFANKAVALQGGEPLLAPDSVFEALGAANVERSLQTNGISLTPEKADRLKRGNYLVGLSLDGPAALNRGRGDEAVFEKIVAAARLLENFAVDYNLLTVVSRWNATKAKEIYRFFRETFATRFYQFIECTGPRDEVTGAAWGTFLIDLFDEWKKADTRVISIRLFDSILSQILRGYPTQCSFATSCRQYLVVEHDGSVYPCDFHVREDLKLGNIMTHSWEELISSPVYEAFARAKTNTLSPACRACAYRAFCQGDCPRNRKAGRSVLCDGWKAFFAHALPTFRALAESVSPTALQARPELIK